MKQWGKSLTRGYRTSYAGVVQSVINVEGVFYNPDTIFRVVRMRSIDGGAEVISQLKNFEGS